MAETSLSTTVTVPIMDETGGTTAVAASVTLVGVSSRLVAETV